MFAEAKRLDRQNEIPAGSRLLAIHAASDVEAIFTGAVGDARAPTATGLPEPVDDGGNCNRLQGASVGRPYARRSSEPDHTPDRITQFCLRSRSLLFDSCRSALVRYT